MALDGREFPVAPGDTVRIAPGRAHARAQRWAGAPGLPVLLRAAGTPTTTPGP